MSMFRMYSISAFGSLFALAVRAPAGVWCVLVVSVVSCGSEQDELGRRVCDYGRFPYTGWLVHAGAFGLGVCLDDVSLSETR